MNRVKKEFRRKGIKLNCDYPWLPFFIKGESIFETGYIFVDEVRIDSENAVAYRYLNVLVQKITLERNGNLNYDCE